GDLRQSRVTGFRAAPARRGREGDPDAGEPGRRAPLHREAVLGRWDREPVLHAPADRGARSPPPSDAAGPRVTRLPVSSFTDPGDDRVLPSVAAGVTGPPPTVDGGREAGPFEHGGRGLLPVGDGRLRVAVPGGPVLGTPAAESDRKTSLISQSRAFVAEQVEGREAGSRATKHARRLARVVLGGLRKQVCEDGGVEDEVEAFVVIGEPEVIRAELARGVVVAVLDVCETKPKPWVSRRDVLLAPANRFRKDVEALVSGGEVIRERDGDSTDATAHVENVMLGA